MLFRSTALQSLSHFKIIFPTVQIKNLYLLWDGGKIIAPIFNLFTQLAIKSSKTSKYFANYLEWRGLKAINLLGIFISETVLESVKHFGPCH